MQTRLTLNLKNQQIDAIHAEQVRQLYAALPMSVIGTMINAGLLVVVQWPVTEHWILMLWLSSVAVIMGLRALSRGLYNRNIPDADCARWGRMFNIGVVAAALSWGAVPVLFFPDGEVVNQALMAVVFSGMAAGAVTTLSFMRFPIYFFASVLLLPLAAHFFMDGGTIGYVIGTMNVLFFIVIMTTARRFYESTRQNIDLRLQAGIRERALAASENKYRHIFNAAPIGIAQYQQDGILLDCNEQFSQLIGRPKRDLIGINLLNTNTDPAVNSALRNSLQGESAQLASDAGIFGGSPLTSIRLMFAAANDPDTEGAAGVVIIEDITERQRVERLKNEFISTVSHELRTPLTSIRGSIKLINGGAVGTVSDEIKPMLEIAETNTERLLHLVNDILDIGKIEAGALDYNMRIVEVTGLVDDVIKRHLSYAEQLGVRFIMPACLPHRVFIQADANRLDQVVSNLLSNAAKFSPSGSDITVTLVQNKDTIRIAITDHGPGIAPEFQDKLFERFTQCDSSDTRAVGGTGLGLSIARALVEHMGGKIGFDSVPGKGSTFYIEFPILNVDRQSVAS